MVVRIAKKTGLNHVIGTDSDGNTVATIVEAAILYDVETADDSDWFVPFVKVDQTGNPTLEEGAADVEVGYGPDTVVSTTGGGIDDPISDPADSWYIVGTDSLTTSAAPVTTLDVSAHKISIPDPAGAATPDDAKQVTILWAEATEDDSA